MINANKGQEQWLLHRAEHRKLVDYTAPWHNLLQLPLLPYDVFRDPDFKQREPDWFGLGHISTPSLSSTVWDLLEQKENSLKKEALSLKESQQLVVRKNMLGRKNASQNNTHWIGSSIFKIIFSSVSYTYIRNFEVESGSI